MCWVLRHLGRTVIVILEGVWVEVMLVWDDEDDVTS
jgi:hypothetical protein